MAIVEAAQKLTQIHLNHGGAITMEAVLTVNGRNIGAQALDYDRATMTFSRGASSMPVSEKVHAALIALWDLLAVEVETAGETKLAEDYAACCAAKEAAR
jgi:hypothetical protein